jgi:hypothetical protein
VLVGKLRIENLGNGSLWQAMNEDDNSPVTFRGICCVLWHILTKPFLYCLYFLGRIVDAFLCAIVLAIVATVNQISFEAFIIVVSLCLDVFRAAPRLREPAAQFVANRPLLQKSLNPRFPHYLAYAIVGGM